MRWVKHLSTSVEDPFISGLLDRYGHSGYAIYWMIVERIARGMDKPDSPPEATMKWSQWCGYLRTRRQYLASMLVNMADAGKVRTTSTTTPSGEYLTIRIEKILTYRDEYSRKLLTHSGQTPDPTPERLRHRAEQSRYKPKPPVDESRFTRAAQPYEYVPKPPQTCSVIDCPEVATYVYQYKPYCDLHKNVPVEEAR